MAQELYELPQGWEWETLQELGKFSGGGTPSKSNPDFWGGNQLWITPKDMKSEKLRDSQLKITDTAIDKSSAKLIPAGSILIVARSGILRHTLPVCINEIEATVNQDIKVFIPSKKITSAFCQKMLIGHEPMILRDLVKGGVTVESLKYQEFQNHPFPVPPLAEQERIVAKLDALFSRIDQAIAQLQHTQAQTKALFASALDAVFESDKHQYKTLKEISNLVTDGTHHSPKIQHPEAGPERFKYLTSKNVKFHGLKLDNLTYIDKDVHEEIYNRCPPEYLDQLITKDGAMTGTCCLNTLDEPYSLLSSVALIKLKREIMEPHFLNYFLRSPRGQNSMLEDIAGAAITRTTLTKLKVLKIPVPPLAEQSKIVAQLDAISERTQALTTATSAQLEKLQALKASLLDAAFRGQLPSDQ